MNEISIFEVNEKVLSAGAEPLACPPTVAVCVTYVVAIHNFVAVFVWVALAVIATVWLRFTGQGAV